MNFKRTVLFLITTISLIITTISCEVGLGEAVDIQEPKVSIATPPMDSIIRGSFAIGGDWNDDSSVSFVDIYLKNIETEQVKKFTWKNDDNVQEKGSWSYLIKQSTDESEKKNNIKDGTYQVTVEAYDVARHVTKDSRLITIDNTAPIIVLDRPGSREDAAKDLLDAYGQKLSILGRAADDNNVDKIEITFKGKIGDKEVNHSVTKENVGNTIDETIAVFEDPNYDKIYGSEKRGTEEYTCTLKAYDKAQKYPEEYPIVKDRTDEDKLGNMVDHYYLFKELSVNLLQKYSVTDLYKMLSGTYVAPSANRDTENTNLTPEKALASLRDPKVQVGIGKFTLNPENNPTYSMFGYTPINTEEEFKLYDYKIETDSRINLEVAPGIDGIALKEPFNSKVEGEKDNYTIKLYPPKLENGKYVIDTSNESNIKTVPNDLIEWKYTNGAYKISFPLALSFMDTYNPYILKVVGSDGLGNELIALGGDNKEYVFNFVPSDIPPVLTVGKINEFYKNNDVLTLKGTIKSTSGEPSLIVKLGVDENGENPIFADTLTLENSNSAGNKLEKKGEIYEYEYKLDFASLSKKYTLSEGFTNLLVIADGKNNLTTENTLSYIYDTTAPTGEIVQEDKWYKTKQIPLSLKNVTDEKNGIQVSGIDSVIATIGNETATLTNRKGIYKGTIDVPNEGENTIDFSISDFAGNTNKSLSVKVKVDTIAPTVTLKGDAKTLITGNEDVVVTLNINDTINSSEIKDITLTKLSGLPVPEIGSFAITKPESLNANGENSITILNSNFPKDKDTASTGPVEFTVEDKAGNKTIFTAFNMTIDKKGPTSTIFTVSDADISTSDIDVNKTLSLRGTLFDDNGIANSELQYKLATDSTWKKYSDIQNSYNWNLDIDTTNTSKFTDGKTYNFRVFAKDIAGYESSSDVVTLKINQDSDRPIISFDDIDLSNMSATAYAKLRKNTIMGSVSDDDRLLEDKIWYNFDESSNYQYSVPVVNGSWSITVADDSQGENNIYLKLTDSKNTTWESNKTYAPKLRGTETTPNDYSILHILVDNQVPVINETKSSSVTKGDVSGNLVLGGTVSDNIGLPENCITVTCNTIKDGNTDKLKEYKTSVSTDGNNTWSVNIPNNEISNGDHVITITAKDNADNITSISKNIKLDRVAPTGKASLVGNTKTWFNTDQIKIQVTDITENGSGINEVSAWIGVDGENVILSPNKEKTIYSGNVTVPNGKESTINFKITDKAGNESNDVNSLKVNVDTKAPTVTLVSGEKTLITGKEDVVVTLNIQDTASSSGIKDITLTKLCGLKIPELGSFAITKPTKLNATGENTITISKSNFAEGIASTGSVEFTVEDIAGNKTIFTAFNMTIDKKGPVSSILTIPDADISTSEIDINKTIKLNGTLFDDNEVAKAELQYKLAQSDVTSWTKYLDIENTYNWHLNVDTTVTSKFTDGKRYLFRVFATDTAGNTSTSKEVAVKINQDSDRPILSFNNIDLTGMNESTFAKLRKTSITGNVTDDDGIATELGTKENIQKLYYKYGENEEFTNYVPIVNGSFTLDLSKIEQGQKTIYFKLKDTANTEWISGTSKTSSPKLKGSEETSPNYSILHIFFDTQSPTLDENKSNVVTKGDGSGNLVLGGTVSDNISLPENCITVTCNTITIKEGNTEKLKEYKTSVSKDGDNTWTLSIPSDEIKDGDHVITITAKDNADNITSISRNIKLDRKAPEGTASLIEKDKIWFNTDQIKVQVTGIKDEGSGVSEVSAWVGIDGEKVILSPNSDKTTYSGYVTVPEGAGNVINFKITDKAGNEFTPSTINASVDKHNPIVSLASVDNEYVNPTEGHIRFEGNKLVNGKNDVTVVISATDDGSGVANVKVTKIPGIPDVSNIVPVKTPETGTTNYIITLPSKNLPKTSATGLVEFEILDNAGNKTVLNAFNLNVDTKVPSVKYNSVFDADASTKEIDVNKTITISGTSSDNNGVSKIELQSSTDKSNWNHVETIFKSADNNLSTWNFSVDTTKYKDISTVSFRAVVTDDAGNSNENEKNPEPISLKINQDSDRPIVSFTTVGLKGTNDLNPAILKNSSRLFGMIEDDDGIKELYISNDKNDWGEKVTITNGSWSKSFEDGTQKLYFKVVASDGTESGTCEWISEATTTEGKNFGPKVKGSDGEIVDNGIVNLCVATQPPTKENVMFKTFGSFTADSYDTLDDYKNTIVDKYQEYKDKLETLGGIHSKFTLKLNAYDANGIASVTGKIGKSAKVEGNITITTYAFNYKDGSGISHTVYGKAKETKDFYKDSQCTVLVPEAEISGATPKYLYDYNTYELEFDVSQMTTGSHTLVYTVTNTAGLVSESSLQVGIDNTKPVITVNGPSSNKTSSGSISVYGDVDSNAKLYYSVKPDTSRGQNDTTYTPKYNRIKDATLSWYVYFDGDKDSSKTSAHGDLMNDYLTKLYTDITSENIKNNSYTDFTPVIFTIIAVDEVGNKTEELSHKIMIDPQGDRPSVTISTPTSGSTVGGAVKFYGTAIDQLGSTTEKIGVDSVWMQIISDKVNNNFYDENNKTVNDSTLTLADINNMRKVGTVYKVSTNKPIESDLPDGTTDLNDYAIKVTNFKGASWNAEINKAGSDGKGIFDPESGATNAVGVRIIAKDKDGKLSLPYECLLLFDADKPVISNLYLTSEDGKKTVEYSEDMYVKGNWTLHGTVEDKDSVGSVSIDGTSVSITQDKKVTFEHNLNLGTTGVGSKEIKIEATDKAQGGANTQTQVLRINFDNKAPSIISDNVSEQSENDKLYYHIDKTIKQSNSFYRFGSRVSEQSVNHTNQSGLAFVAAYFIKNENGKRNLYNPLLSYKDRPYDSYQASSRVTDVTKQDAEDGLYWISLGATQDTASQDVFTLDSTNLNVHKNSLVKINGTYYLIKEISSDKLTITLNGKPRITNTKTKTTIKIANALIIDNSVQETGSGELNENGYYKTVINDDGDGMEEVANKSGSNWDWEAAISARNIPDGPVELHYVAFDKAGNFSAAAITDAKVENNPPRLSGLKIWSDLNLDGNDTAEEDFNFTFEHNGKKDVTRDLIIAGENNTASRTIKDNFTFIPEIVGGNGNLYYSYSIGEDLTKPTINSKDNVFASLTDGTTQVTGNDHDEYVKDGATTSRIPVDAKILGKITENSSNEKPTWFKYTIWDSTSGTTKNKNSLSSSFSVALNLQHNDMEAPKASITPFYWNNSTDNSLFKNSVDNGHIELESELPPTFKDNAGLLDRDPKVSGKITIKGTASDDVRVGSLVFTFADVKVTATYNANGTWSYTPDTNNPTSTLDDDSYSLLVENGIFSEEEGFKHNVNWTLSLDTSKLNYNGKPETEPKQIGTGLDKTLTVTVKEAKGATPKTASANYKMDVVPYIADINTSFSSFDVNNPTIFTRSSMGHYSVRSDETITLAGFNLEGATYGNVDSKLKLEAPADMNLIAVAYQKYPSFVQLPVSKLSNSGEIEIEVNGVKTLNNLNNNDAQGSAKGSDGQTVTVNEDNYKDYAYNRRPNGSNNNLLTDDVFIDVWEFSEIKKATSGMITEPIMHVNPTNDLLCFAFNEDPVNFFMSDGTSNSFTQWQRSNAPYVSSDFIIDAFGKTHGVTVNTDMMRAESDGEAGQNKQAGAARMTYMYGNWGASHVTGNSGAGVQGTFTGINCSRLESIGVPASGTELAKILTDRFPNPTLASSTHDKDKDTHVYIAYYDKINGEIRFRWGNLSEAKAQQHIFKKTNGVGEKNAGYTFNQIADSRSSVTNGASFGNFEGQHARDLFEPSKEFYSVVADKNTTVHGGEYVSIAVVPGASAAEDDTVVMTWFDEINNAWMYSYKTNPCNDNDMGATVTDSSGTWSDPITLKAMAGEYCKITVDKNKGVHIVSYDIFNSDLLYVYLPKYNSTYSEETSLAVVDSYGMVGTDINIDTAIVDGYVVPFISYYAGSVAKPKMAYMKGVINSDTSTLSECQGAINQRFTQKWEVTNIPVSGVMKQDNINVAVWKDVDGIVKAPKNKTDITTENKKHYGNNSSNPVIGYVKSDGVLETAQMKALKTEPVTPQQ